MDATYYGIAMRQGNSPNKTAVCDEVTVTYQWDTEIGTVLLCRALVNAGKADGEMLFEDDSGYSITIPSIHAWVEHQPTYQGQFDRNPDASVVNWHACNEVRVEPAYYENGIVKLCQAMCDAGRPDGDLMLTETRRREPLRHYIPSIQHYAQYRLISEAAEEELAERTAAKSSAPIAKPKASVLPKRMTDDCYQLLLAVQQGNSKLWKAAHHPVRLALTNNGYVNGTSITLTDEGKQAIARHEKPYDFMSPEQLVAIAETFGLHINGNGSQLAATLSQIDAVIAARSLDEVATMATRHGVPLKYGTGKKLDPFKKRMLLVALLNDGHEIAA